MVKIKFKLPSAAQECIKMMDGRFFGGRQISCFYWDGKTDYKRAPESEEEMKKRIEEFGEWLEDKKEDESKGQPKNKSEDKPEDKEEDKLEDRSESEEEEETGVSGKVADAIQKMLEEKLAQLREEKLKDNPGSAST